jgi:hypothetical protein
LNVPHNSPNFEKFASAPSEHARRSLTLDAPEYFVAIVDDPAGRLGITPEKFMNAILTEGLFEAYLELRAQMNDAARAKKQTPPGRGQT